MMRVIFLLFALSLSACVHTGTPINGNRFVTPEVEVNGMAASVYYGGSVEVESYKEKEDVPPTFDPEVVSDSVRGLRMDVRAGKQVEVFLTSDVQVGIKYQILGQPRGSAKEGNVSLAVGITGMTYGNGELTEDRHSDTLNQDIKVTTATSGQQIDPFVVAGYRWNKDILGYMTIGRVFASNRTKVTQEYTPAGASETSKQETTTGNKNGHSDVINVGGKFLFDRYFLVAEAGFMNTQWPKAPTKSSSVLGLQFGMFVN